MTNVSYDNNYMVPLDGKDWCSLKCENDLDYIEPFVDGDALYFQFVIPYGQYIGYWDIVNLSATVIPQTIDWQQYYGTVNGDEINTIVLKVTFDTDFCATASAANKCFRLQLNIYDDEFPGGTMLYIMRSNLFTCTFCQTTVTIQSSYSITDCLGNYYNNGRIAQDIGLQGNGDEATFSNSKRIYATLKKLPSKISLSSNSNCYLYKSEIIEAYELQGTKLYPPYVARQIENIMLGRNLTINGEQYQLRGDSIFQLVKEQGMSMFKLNAQLEKCPCEVVFDCV